MYETQKDIHLLSNYTSHKVGTKSGFERRFSELAGARLNVAAEEKLGNKPGSDAVSSRGSGLISISGAQPSFCTMSLRLMWGLQTLGYTVNQDDDRRSTRRSPFPKTPSRKKAH